MHHFFQGKTLRQAHKGIPEGHYEEEQGLKGFFGPVSHLVKKKPSTRWTQIDGPLKPRMFDCVELKASSGWQRTLFNEDVTIYFQDLEVDEKQLQSAIRNGDGDTLYFCHAGKGRIYSEYGLLTYSKGEYVCVPKGLTHSFVAEEPSRILIIENKTSHYEEPDRGVAGRNAIYDTQTIGRPDLDTMNAQIEGNESKWFKQVRVKRQDQWTTFTYEECYYDVVGWKGDLFPYTLHMDNIMPLMSHRAYLPPSAHTNFVARGFVVCSFLPRPLESDSDALKVPFYHQNIDYDEVLFYHDGDFFSRDNLHPGMMSLHPAGFPHGPHPKAVKGIGTKTHTEEYAVMVDTLKPLQVDESLDDVELSDYWKSWQG